MKLRKKLFREIAAPLVLFIGAILLVSTLFLSLNHSLHTLIMESEPTQAAIEHMIQDVYRDNIILLEYLNTQDYRSAVLLDMQVEEFDHLCSEVENNIENLILTGALSDEGIIEEYEQALVLHDTVEQLRDELIALHKEELALGSNLDERKQELISAHSNALQDAIAAFTQTTQNIETKNSAFKERILFQSRLYSGIVIVLIVLFSIITIDKITKISTQVVEPLDRMMSSTNKFVEGDYHATIPLNGSFSEISQLQESINRVFSVIRNDIKRNPDRKSQVDLQLLKKEYVAIIDYLKENHAQGRQTNITDLKKHFQVTHPTILDRLHFLEQRGFISIHKEGREKFVRLLASF